MIEAGVARPIAHGQAMIKTATVFRSANVKAATPMTAGTNTALILSAWRWMGPWTPEPPRPSA